MHGGDFAHVDNHPGDLGTETHEEELDETAGIFFDEEERRIAEARRALADGSYGTCINCHRPIPPERLHAVPEAVRCLEAPRLFEGLRRHAPGLNWPRSSSPAPPASSAPTSRGCSWSAGTRSGWASRRARPTRRSPTSTASG